MEREEHVFCASQGRVQRAVRTRKTVEFRGSFLGMRSVLKDDLKHSLNSLRTFLWNLGFTILSIVHLSLHFTSSSKYFVGPL